MYTISDSFLFLEKKERKGQNINKVGRCSLFQQKKNSLCLNIHHTTQHPVSPTVWIKPSLAHPFKHSMTPTQTSRVNHAANLIGCDEMQLSRPLGLQSPPLPQSEHAHCSLLHFLEPRAAARWSWKKKRPTFLANCCRTRRIKIIQTRLLDPRLQFQKSKIWLHVRKEMRQNIGTTNACSCKYRYGWT